MMVFENRVLSRVFGSKRGDVTGQWRKLHNEELSVFILQSVVKRSIRGCLILVLAPV